MTDRPSKEVRLETKLTSGDFTAGVSIEGDESAITDFIKKIIPEPLKDLSAIISNEFRLLRLKNTLSVINRAKKAIDQSGLELREVPTRILISFFDNASIEDRAQLQEKWANLLANLSTGQIDQHTVYIKLLSELSPDEARLLDHMYDHFMENGGLSISSGYQFDITALSNLLGIEEKASWAAADNLIRLNLVQRLIGIGMSMGSEPFMRNQKKSVVMTDLGFNFVRACRFTTIE
jgi:hypothetical protein